MANSKRPPNPKEPDLTPKGHRHRLRGPVPNPIDSPTPKPKAKAASGPTKAQSQAAVYGAFKQGVRGDSTQPKNFGSKKLAGEEYEAWKRGFNTKDVTGSSAMERNFIGAGGNGATPKPKPKGK